MNRNRVARRLLLQAGAGASLWWSGSAARGQVAADKTINFIVPFSAGSGPDTIARVLAQYLGEKWNRTIVTFNRPGASGNLGASVVARAIPDGATMLVTANTLVMNVSLFSSIPYDPVSSFEPVAGLVYSIFACAVHESLGISTLAALIDAARKRPGELIFGSPGVGSPHHVALELFKQKTGIDIKHVPYGQLAGAMQDLSAGQISGMFLPALQGVSLATGGHVKVLAISGTKRISLAPDVPTMQEAGVSGVEIDNWWAILAPARTPREIVSAYNEAINQILLMPDIQARLESQALQVIGGPPEHLRDIISADLIRWSSVIKAANIKPE